MREGDGGEQGEPPPDDVRLVELAPAEVVLELPEHLVSGGVVFFHGAEVGEGKGRALVSLEGLPAAAGRVAAGRRRRRRRRGRDVAVAPVVAAAAVLPGRVAGGGGQVHDPIPALLTGGAML